MRPLALVSCGLIALIAVSLVNVELAHSQANAPATPFDRTAMLAHLAHQVMLPTYLTFEAEAIVLQRAIATLCQAPTPARLEAAQAGWRRAAQRWRRSEAYQLDLTQTYAKSIGFWPTRPRRLRAALASETPATPTFVESMGTAAHGLAAMEYMLFDAKAGQSAVLKSIQEAPTAQRRCAYLVAMAEHLAGRAQAVAQLWRPDGGDLSGKVARAGQGGTTYPTSHNAISELVNQLVTAVETVQHKKIGKPLRGNGRKPWPNAVEAGRSGGSKALLIATLEGALAIYSGETESTSGPGFKAFLAALGSDLSHRVTAQFHTALSAVRDIPAPLRTAIVEQPQLVQAAHDAIHRLLILLKVDMTNVLSVTVDFSDNDGD